jgi:glucokinase
MDWRFPVAKKAKSQHWVGFDLGGTKMFAVVFDDAFKAVGKKRRKTKGNEGAEAGVERVISTIDEALADAGLGREDVAGIGIGCPGPLDLDRGVLLDSPNLGWRNVPLKKLLEKAFGCPSFILNDVDSGVYGEYRFGAAKGAHCAVGVFPGTGIGGGCVYEGKLLRGKTGSAFEIGHMQVDADGPLCGCGRTGCLEAVASRLAIASAAVAAAYRGEAPSLLAEIGTDLSQVRSGVLARSVEAGDCAVEQIIRRASRLTGKVVGDVVNLVSPEIVVLGGGLVEAMPKLIVPEVLRAARERAMPAYTDTFEVRAAELGDDASVLGAAAWAQAQVAPTKD